MRIYYLYFFLFLCINNNSIKAQKYPCELTYIGKLILKPLQYGSKIIYDNAAYNEKKVMKKNKHDDVVIQKKDSLGNTLVARIHKFNKDSLVRLGFFYGQANEKCEYELSFIDSDPKREKADLKYPRSYPLLGNGEIDPQHLTFTNFGSENRAKDDIENLLKIFE